MNEYTAKITKTFTGMEGQGFNAYLLRNGKSIARVIYYGDGGPQHFVWDSDDEEKAFSDYAASLPDVIAENMSLKMDAELYAGQLVDEALELRQYRQLCARKTVFRVKGYKLDEWRTINFKFSPAIEQMIHSCYGDNLIEILNKRKGVSK